MPKPKPSKPSEDIRPLSEMRANIAAVLGTSKGRRRAGILYMTPIYFNRATLRRPDGPSRRLWVG